MRNLLLYCVVLLILFSCKSVKQVKVNTIEIGQSSNQAKVENIIDLAKSFKGVRYKYGGSSKKGMDCSGLIQTSFKSELVVLPRTTKDLVKSGNWIALNKVKKGDLLFFATSKNSKNINHVGLVTTIQNGEIHFIHSSSSQGVIISNLKQRYWYLAFVQARRVL